MQRRYNINNLLGRLYIPADLIAQGKTMIEYNKWTSINKWRRHWKPTPVLLPVKSHGRRSLVGCSPWGREELDMTEQLHFHFHALEKEMAVQYSCLENPRDGGAWWAAIYGSQRVGHNWSDLAAAAAINKFHNMFIFMGNASCVFGKV